MLVWSCNVVLELHRVTIDSLSDTCSGTTQFKSQHATFCSKKPLRLAAHTSLDSTLVKTSQAATFRGGRRYPQRSTCKMHNWWIPRQCCHYHPLFGGSSTYIGSSHSYHSTVWFRLPRTRSTWILLSLDGHAQLSLKSIASLQMHYTNMNIPPASIRASLTSTIIESFRWPWCKVEWWSKGQILSSIIDIFPATPRFPD